MENFGWTLREIDETDMVRMFEFVLYYLYWKKRSAPAGKQQKKPVENKAYADQIDWSKL